MTKSQNSFGSNFFKKIPLPDSFTRAMASSTAGNTSIATSTSSSDLGSSDKPFDPPHTIGMSRPASSAYRLGLSDGASSQSVSQSMDDDYFWKSMDSEGKSYESSVRSSEASVADIKKTRPYKSLEAKYLDSVNENHRHEDARTATRFLFNISNIETLKEWQDFIQRLIESRNYEDFIE